MDELKEHLKKSIKLAQIQIKRFDKEKLQTEEGNEEYNQLLLKKAIMLKRLNHKNEQRLHAFLPKLIRKITGKTLICDRF